MPAQKHLQKQPAAPSKPAPSTAQNHEHAQPVGGQLEAPQQMSLASTYFSPAMLGHLQRTIGNHATQRMVAQPVSGAIARMPSYIDHSPRSAQGDASIQRTIEKMEGASSGWFRKGRRDKINEMVDSYNIMEMKLAGSKRSAASYQTLIPEIQKIWQAAKAWQVDVMKSSPEKAAEIGEWIVNQVEVEEDTKKVQIAELNEAAGLKIASDGASYNALYATPEFTAGAAGVRWLQTPALAPIYRYFLIQIQYEGMALKGFEAVTAYRANPTRAEAIRIYHEFDMGTSSKLNITGEGPKVGGQEAIGRVRQQITALEADPSAPVPADFGAIEISLLNVINEMFIAFRSTAPYKKVVTPPPAAG